MNRQSAGRAPRWATTGAFAWAALLMLVTLSPSADGSGAGRWAWVGPSPAVADGIANILVFVPLGALACAALGSVRAAVLVVALLSLVIEVAQGMGIPGRYATASDLFANVLGGAIGAMLAERAGEFIWPSRPVAWRLIVAWAGLAATVLVGSTWLSAPGEASEASEAYEGQHAETWNAQRNPEHGLRDVRFNGRYFEWGLLPNPGQVTRGIRDEQLRLEIALDPGDPGRGTHRLAAVIAADGSFENVARLEVNGSEIRFRTRARAEHSGLHAPFVRLSGAFPAPSDSARPPIMIGGARDGPLLAIWVHAGDATRLASLRLTPLDAWMFLLPPTLASRAEPWFFRLLVGLLLFGPLAWWLVAVVRGGAGLRAHRDEARSS